MRNSYEIYTTHPWRLLNVCARGTCAGHKKLATRKTKTADLCLEPTRVLKTFTHTVSMDYVPKYAPLPWYVKQALEAGAMYFASPALSTLDENTEHQEGLHKAKPR